jgi:CHAD domain-containing protein
VEIERAEALQPLSGLERVDERDELQSALCSHLEELAAHEAGTRSGTDPEDLHKFRVATRRMRSLLRSTRKLVADPAESERLRAELKWLGSLLGEVRDRDVLIDYLLEESKTLDGAPLGAMLERLDAERDEARRELVAALDSPRYELLVRDLERQPALRPGETLVDAARGDDKRLRKTMNGLGKDPTDEELHEARIRVKRARYAVEAAGLGSRFVQRAKELQDVLGEHQDGVVAEERIRELLEQVRGSGRTAFAAGRLVERQRLRRDASRKAWPKAWQRLRKAGERIF